ncbi:long-chain acyl-CoA synthetase [Laceyella sediminis]|uniref:Long-chain acyl-CoA synthetase n=1 Tax=Laceyella sediminis TaxID=573074 RepID=A0ABX5EPS7_9BACL|nr:long-chain-fatty-acid--CoA ligase [Laceyella sediminis]PRZ13527.1 long-chain acyl-CoA synthetase [Laceyella sediminis]
MILTKGLIRSAQNFSDRLAVVDGKVAYTYRAFSDRVSQLQQALKQEGIEKGDRVAILMFNDFRYLELFYAVTAIGAIAVPLNYRLTAAEIVEQLRDSSPKALFFHQEFAPIVAGMVMRVLSVRLFVRVEGERNEEETGFMIDYEEFLRPHSPQPLAYGEVIEDDVAGIFYTGGTTGRSKGVMLTHRNLVSNAYHAALAFCFDRYTRYVHAAPMFHLADGACTFALTLVGGTHQILRTFQPDMFLDWVEQAQPTTTLLVPTMVNRLINHPDVEKRNCSSLRQLLYGGSAMPVEVLKKAREVWPHLSFMQAYGMSEAAPVVTVLPPEDHQVEERLASCGQVVTGVEAKIIDDHGGEVGVREVGELIVRGPNVMKGYWNSPEETDLVLKGGWYHTGDMVYRDEQHYLYVVDRKKDMIVTGGENVYSIEVEQVLYQHPAVLEAAVIGVPDPVWVEAVKALVVKRADQEVDTQTLLDFCRERLAGFKVPKSLKFVEELPKNAAGKILKRTLREQYSQPAD